MRDLFDGYHLGMPTERGLDEVDTVVTPKGAELRSGIVSMTYADLLGVLGQLDVLLYVRNNCLDFGEFLSRILVAEVESPS